MKKESLLKPENAVFNQTVKAGDYFLHDVKAGQKFRIVDVEGNQASDSLFYNTYNKEEPYSAENTIREQMNIFLTTGTVLRTNFNKPMLKIVADNCGRHDTLGGACATESNTVRYAIEKKFMHACRDSWMLACNEKPEDGLTKRDIAHNINFFMNVPVNEDGYLTFADGISAPSLYVEFEALMDTTILISNCPQLNNPCNAYNPTPVQVLVWD
jgi:uncharacterized protein